MNRRDLLKSAGSAVGLTILESGALRGRSAPSDKLNVALIGVWGRGTAHYDSLRNENVVALCDVNDLRTKEALALFPKAKTYWDWRRVLDQKDVEAVVICTADHHHAFIANWALNRDMHVFCEKPLGISVEEARMVRANYLKRKSKVATQHGTQRHAFPNFERVRELILDGAIGDLKTVHAWDSRQLPRPGYPAGEGMPPAALHYEQWIGAVALPSVQPAVFRRQQRPELPVLEHVPRFRRGPDGRHGRAYHGPGLERDRCRRAHLGRGRPGGRATSTIPDICPVKLKVSFAQPGEPVARPDYGGVVPGRLEAGNARRVTSISTASATARIFEGTKGAFSPTSPPASSFPTMTTGISPITSGARRNNCCRWWRAPDSPPQRRAAPDRAAPAASAPPPLPRGFTAWPSAQPGPDGFAVVQFLDNGLPAALGLPNTDVQAVLDAEKNGRPRQAPTSSRSEWLDACKGKYNGVTHGTSSKTHCDFDYSGTMIEQMLLGLVAHRAGKKLEYDAATGRVTNSTEANDLLKRQYRSGWTLNG